MSHQKVLLLVFQVCVVSASLRHLFSNDYLGLIRELHNFLCLFNPLYPLMGCLNCITEVGLQIVPYFMSHCCFEVLLGDVL